MLPLAVVVRDIRRQRVLLDLSQADLARAAGTSQSLVAKLERGRINPSYEVVRRIVEALDRIGSREEEKAQQLMQRNPVWVEPGQALGDALARMKDRGFSQLPVLDRGVPVGSLSESALLERIEQGADLPALKRQPVSMVMGESFPTVDPGTPRRVLVELLRRSEAVLVVHEGRLVGVVTKSDLW